jgi:uncharacterized protein (DUF697 family)
MYPSEEFESEEFEFEFESEEEMQSPFSEAEEMELATQLLGVSSEDELDQFLGSLVKRAWSGVKSVASKVARSPLGGILKSVAKKALPFVGGALGSFIPIPGVGTMIGRAVGTAASNLLETELEGLNEEEQEFEMARRFVRFAGAASKATAKASTKMPPAAAARHGVVTAARRLAAAPGVQGPVKPHGPHRPPVGPRPPHLRRPAYPIAPSTYPDFDSPDIPVSTRTGRWIRRGRNIIIVNCNGGRPGFSSVVPGSEGVYSEE